MKKTSKLGIAAFLISCLIGLVVTSCHKGPAETAGQNIDKAVQNTKDALTNKQ